MVSTATGQPDSSEDDDDNTRVSFVVCCNVVLFIIMIILLMLLFIRYTYDETDSPSYKPGPSGGGGSNPTTGTKNATVTQASKPTTISSTSKPSANSTTSSSTSSTSSSSTSSSSSSKTSSTTAKTTPSTTTSTTSSEYRSDAQWRQYSYRALDTRVRNAKIRQGGGRWMLGIWGAAYIRLMNALYDANKVQKALHDAIRSNFSQRFNMSFFDGFGIINTIICDSRPLGRAGSYSTVHLPLWNEFFWRVGLQLRELHPGELSVVATRLMFASPSMMERNDAATLLCQLLSHHHCIASVHLKYNVFNSHYEMICEALRKTGSLRKLALCPTIITLQASQCFAAALPRLNQLQELEVGEAFFSRATLEGLFEFLTTTRSLTTFTVTAYCIKGEHAVAVLQGLGQNMTISTLSLHTDLPEDGLLQLR
ncbi:hypothetical protein MTO96_039653 [Rhipicephalus appendiculatus]